MAPFKLIELFFAICVKKYYDGGIAEYYDFGYKVIKYNVITSDEIINNKIEKTVFGFWTLEYKSYNN